MSRRGRTAPPTRPPDITTGDAPWTTLQEALAGCVNCGKCLPDCPLYQLSRREEDGIRGKLNVLRWHLGAGFPPSPAATRLFWRCLLCLRCQDACPSGLELMRIMDAARAALHACGLAPIPGRPGARRAAFIVRAVRRNRTAPPRLPPRPRASLPPVTPAGVGRPAPLLVSPLGRAVWGPALVAAAALFHRGGLDPVVQVLRGPSPVRLHWRGDTGGLRAALEAAFAGAPMPTTLLFLEPELAALWRAHGAPAQVIDLESWLLGGGAAIRLDAPSVTALPAPVPMAAADWRDWLAQWRALAPAAWRPPPAESRGLRAEPLAPIDPLAARDLARRWLHLAGATGAGAVAITSPRTQSWLRSGGGPGLPLRPLAILAAGGRT
ncbi:MAG TPA: (Fe-S)-binding protein [Acidobacteriota bacterium]|nr:(Fe-S)-binding protein [Acidobacteriota bacterium]HNR38367.1 (Fe-S)-binding protein [Acidobacteriota bacterium]HNU00805.1 (Fe-S)-binding protein [Acidobacteriota bacterium]HPB26900.1 (Fe-S)-binding protein [Acidobacteriota bacterium]HQO24775.1 (Fe-S)-binding protein [Acidobacteriota bacterium]